jgi:hypothetical protein
LAAIAWLENAKFDHHVFGGIAIGENSLGEPEG